MEPDESIRLLIERARALGRLPIKSDFEPETADRIKNVLGPWPRALEQAGLKPVPERRLLALETRRKRKKEKRKAAWRRKEREAEVAREVDGTDYHAEDGQGL